jgi:hypothetical protein
VLMLYACSSKAPPVDLLTNGFRSNYLPVAPLRSHVVAVLFDMCVLLQASLCTRK